MKDDKVYLIHILECIEDIEKYLDGKKSNFIQKGVIQDAILRKLQIMAETTQRLSKELKLSAPDIPWQDIADFRNVLVHEYLGLDMEIIWNAVDVHVPILKSKVQELLKV